MPTLTIYIKDEDYRRYVDLPEGRKAEVRSTLQEEFKKEVKKK